MNESRKINELKDKLLEHLNILYPHDVARECGEQLLQRIDRYNLIESQSDKLWDEKDIVMIAYGDHVKEANKKPLQSFKACLDELELKDCLSTVHLLPFFPYSSDEGFSVIDYKQIDPLLGNWTDVQAVGTHFDLMFDFPLNHISSHSEWFRSYLNGVAQYQNFFVETDPNLDLSLVTRPRSLPLLTRFETSEGPKHLWTTFSADQIDLNFQNPRVLVEMVDILLFYLAKGARIIRLDAIAFLWKIPGTNCLHLPETHQVVKLMREITNEVSPHAILLTETNVPHEENVSYFGAGDEAHMVYQFSLPPLLLEGLLTGTTGDFKKWLASVCETAPNTTFFNFTASHDGIGVRPLQGLISHDRFGHLLEAVRERGGRVSYKRNTDGSESPYELNITYFSALKHNDEKLHVARFVASQAMALALKGVPAIYFPALFAGENDEQGAKLTGQNRSINRRRYSPTEIGELLSEKLTAKTSFNQLRSLMRVRRSQKAFHPDATQRLLDAPEGVVAFERLDTTSGEKISVAVNFTDTPQKWNAPWGGKDLVSGAILEESVSLSPYQVVWIKF